MRVAWYNVEFECSVNSGKRRARAHRIENKRVARMSEVVPVDQHTYHTV